MDTKTLAKELLAKNVLNEPTFTIKELFEIRDALMILAKYGLQDQDLLDECLRYLAQKGNE